MLLKEDNTNNLDENEKKYSKEKSPTLLTAILQKRAKGTELKNTRKRKRKGKECNNICFMIGKIFMSKRKEKAKKSIWQWVESFNLNINQSIFHPSRWINLWFIVCMISSLIHLNLRNCFHDFTIYPFIHSIVIHKNKKRHLFISSSFIGRKDASLVDGHLNWGMKKKANGKQSEVHQEWCDELVIVCMISSFNPLIHFIVMHTNERCFGLMDA